MLKLKRRQVSLVIDPGVIDLTRLELELALILFKIAIWYPTVIILRSPLTKKRTVTSAFHTMRASFRRLVKRRKQGAKQTTIVDGGIIRFDL